MERFDALVVGAGPAGSTAAIRLARAGASVLLCDKARFPRDKPCGGGLTLRAVRALPVPVDLVVEHEVDTVEIGLAYRRRFERSSREPIVLMTQRRRLDAYLAEQAATAGADFREGAKVSDVVVTDDGVEASVDGTRVRGATLICAHGCNGGTARALGLGGDYDYGVALEGNLPYAAAPRDRYERRLLLEFGVVRGGYGWVFPKGDHVNVGVGGWQRDAPRLREHLRRLCDEYGLPQDALENVRGHRLPLRRPGDRLARGRALVVGDAAGLVDPLSGDGMWEAFVSSKLAAEAVADLLAGRTGNLEPYESALMRALGRHTAASWSAKIALERFPLPVFTIARLPAVWRVCEALVRGDLGHPSAARGPARAPLKLLERLARAAGDPGRPYRSETAAALR